MPQLEVFKDRAPGELEKPPEVTPAVCEFKGYLRDDGKIVITSESEECRKAIVEAGAEMGVEVEVEIPAEECEPCKEAAKSFLTRIRAMRAITAERLAAEPPAAPAEQPAAEQPAADPPAAPVNES
ncbi:hypothetical protein ES703_102030 [subsurface metagenome]